MKLPITSLVILKKKSNLNKKQITGLLNGFNLAEG